ncbi:transmembrane protein 165 isoform X2 [Zalophus californianus]|uniref:GDT1 family protein n=1 Tax=Zalophus californianus TaxID=9704 RepID=A0A6J2DMP3_ZALCA|nr:transmembrane protein 165 isoform X2 [Zalophus californianus]
MAAAAARGSGRASAPRLLLLLLLALLWAPTGVGAVPNEDLSHRNKEPPAPAQQLQPQPAAVQGPEAARAEKGFTPAAPVHGNKEDPAAQTNLGFIHAFVAAISVIIVSELGDKTFFIAAIMAMRYNRLTVLAGAMLALGLMTCLSEPGAKGSSTSSTRSVPFPQPDGWLSPRPRPVCRPPAPLTAAVGNRLQQGSACLFLGYPGSLGETLYTPPPRSHRSCRKVFTISLRCCKDLISAILCKIKLLRYSFKINQMVSKYH